jgi:hypothetical protein
MTRLYGRGGRAGGRTACCAATSCVGGEREERNRYRGREGPRVDSTGRKWWHAVDGSRAGSQANGGRGDDPTGIGAVGNILLA